MRKKDIMEKWGVSSGLVVDVRKESGVSASTGSAQGGGNAIYPQGRQLLEEREVLADGTLKLTKVAERVIPLSEWLEDLRLDGHNPDDFDTSHGHSIYLQHTRDQVTKTLYANKFSATRRNKKLVRSATDIDPLALLNSLRAQSPARPSAYVPIESDEDSAFIISINDIQLGQAYNGGSPRAIKQFYEFITLAQQRVLELRALGRRLSTLVVVGGGDLVEGCVIYGNQAFSLDLNRKQQVEGVVSMILHTIDSLGPMFSRIKVLAARGNHGENRINGKYTTLDDNDDTHAFEMAKLALSRDPDYADKIEWTIAESEAGVWCEVFGWVLVTTHGDIYAKGVSGATIDKKAHTWMKNMALGRGKFGRLGEADVLITHHFHHDKMSDWGSCLWRQTPSQDNGSPYFEMATGEYSEPGMLSFVMTENTRYQDEAVLRVAGR
ncbi:hypothetical protein [Microbacterium sp. zg-YB36]|uniref:hypothetical protein n=1 Tax=Microbacterium sp. zg-YB36 TaxID=2969407 RepID=UPI00214B4DCC|nr:hypothetical protein [Microbacterium sp. zg-YB36]MDL5351111.1 hypothetical protein [Microbacterium sp. zg-YB36]